MKHDLIYLVTHVQDVTGYNEYEVWTDKQKAYARVKEMISSYKAEYYNPEEIYHDDDFHLDVWDGDARHTISIQEIYSNQPYNNNYCSMRLYSRKCDITGEGMNEGYLIEDSITQYIEKQSDLIKWLRENGDSEYNNASDEFILDEAYEQGVYLWTEWYEEGDIQYLHDYVRGEMYKIEPAKVVDYRDLEEDVVESLKKGCWYVRNHIENDTTFVELVTADLRYIRVFPERVVLEESFSKAI